MTGIKGGEGGGRGWVRDDGRKRGREGREEGSESLETRAIIAVAALHSVEVSFRKLPVQYLDFSNLYFRLYALVLRNLPVTSDKSF